MNQLPVQSFGVCLFMNQLRVWGWGLLSYLNVRKQQETSTEFAGS